MRAIMIGVLAVGLASCGQEGPDYNEMQAASEEEGAAAASEKMLAGRWSQSISLEEFNVPGAPPGSEELLKEAFGSSTATETCLSQEQLDEGVEERAKKAVQGQQCDTEGFERASGKIHGIMNCSSGPGTSTLVEVSGQYSAETLDMALAMTLKDPTIPGGEGSLTIKMESKRIGDCAG